MKRIKKLSLSFAHKDFFFERKNNLGHVLYHLFERDLFHHVTQKKKKSSDPLFAPFSLLKHLWWSFVNEKKNQPLSERKENETSTFLVQSNYMNNCDGRQIGNVKTTHFNQIFLSEKWKIFTIVEFS
jgi:hypothetical protein